MKTLRRQPQKWQTDWKYGKQLAKEHTYKPLRIKRSEPWKRTLVGFFLSCMGLCMRRIHQLLESWKLQWTMAKKKKKWRYTLQDDDVRGVKEKKEVKKFLLFSLQVSCWAQYTHCHSPKRDWLLKGKIH